MITMMMQGGIGNQMLQYAFGLSLARRLNTELVLDITSFRRDNLRQYNLSLFKGVTERLVYDSVPTIREKGLPYDQTLVDSVKDGDVVIGYFPTEKYFEDVKTEVAWRFCSKQLFPPTVRNNIDEILAAGRKSTYLTIRRTDYVQKQDFHGVLPISYYRQALAYIEERQGPQTLFVFSDEPEWCESHLDVGKSFTVLGARDMTTPKHLGREDVDLHMMALCRNAITANSSFSWWGAWLGEQWLSDDELITGSKGIITAPKRWFTTPTLDWRDIVPDRWVKL